jgi:hypothetical protein
VTPDAAVAVALRALAHVVGDAGLRQRLMAASGLDAATLRARADDPALLGGVLDFLLQDETALLVFCEASGLPPDLPARARRALPGGGT